MKKYPYKVLLNVSKYNNKYHPSSQIGSDLNLTLIKLLVLVVSFTGVFRTTCVPEEGEPREPGEFDKPRSVQEYL